MKQTKCLLELLTPLLSPTEVTVCLILAAELKSPGETPGESHSPFRRVVILPPKAGDAVRAQLLNPRHAGACGECEVVLQQRSNISCVFNRG